MAMLPQHLKIQKVKNIAAETEVQVKAALPAEAEVAEVMEEEAVVMEEVTVEDNISITYN
jgi:hypothetical protein